MKPRRADWCNVAVRTIARRLPLWGLRQSSSHVLPLCGRRGACSFVVGALWCERGYGHQRGRSIIVSVAEPSHGDDEANSGLERGDSVAQLVLGTREHDEIQRIFDRFCVAELGA